MDVDLGDSDAAVGVGLQVITDFFAELTRLGRLQSVQEFDREIGQQTFRITVLRESPTFEMVKTGPNTPRTVLRLKGTVTLQSLTNPGNPPNTVPFEAAVLLTLVLVPGAGASEVGLRYDGVDGTPTGPLDADDIDAFMSSPEVQQALSAVRFKFAQNLISGLNQARFPDPAVPPPETDWTVQLTLMPGGTDAMDAFAVSVGPPGTTAVLVETQSFVALRTGLAVVLGRGLLDFVLGRGAENQEGEIVEAGSVTALDMFMADNGISIKGHVVREIDTPIIDVTPDVDIDFEGVAIPQLVRGTTAMTMDTSDLDVDVDDSDEVFYGALSWVLTIGSIALLFTGVGWAAALSIALWTTLVQAAWNVSVALDNVPNVLRNSLASILGAMLSDLSAGLDQTTASGDLTVESTPDSVAVINGNLVMSAQIIIVAMSARLRSAEYSRKLRRFAIFELEDRRKFRAQELARLMKAGKIAVPGFHHVRGDYIRSDHDDSAANNLLKSFKTNETREVVVRNL